MEPTKEHQNGHLNGHLNGQSVAPSTLSAVGGQGAGPIALHDDHHKREGVGLVRRAVRQRWGITDEHRKQIPEVLASIAAGGEDERARVGAAKVMREMERDNQADDHAEGGVGGKGGGDVTVNVQNVIRLKPIVLDDNG